MYKATIQVPVVGYTYITVDSVTELTEEQWIEAALTSTDYQIEEKQLVRRIVNNNVCYAPINAANVYSIDRYVDC